MEDRRSRRATPIAAMVPAAEASSFARAIANVCTGIAMTPPEASRSVRAATVRPMGRRANRAEPMPQYAGPKKIVILGGGLAGLAAMDALTKSIASARSPAPDIEVVLVEAEAHMGGRAGSRPLDAVAHLEHPNAPWGTNTPHG